MNSISAAASMCWRPSIIQCMGAEQYQERSESFTAARDDVRRHLVDQSHFAVQAFADPFVDRRQIIADQLADIFYFH